ncbi:MAG: hypothetical protein HYU57_03930 [Micavibrio aeruginosavorus]|nr:hypothetical protein [Micavibrio aeruginosavorus]
MTDYIYETNPPLNLFTYIVPVMLDKWAVLPLHYGLFAFSCAMVALSCAAIYAILKDWPFLRRHDLWIMISGFVLANTVMTGSQFGERDQYVALGLIPFILLQIATTYGLPYPKWMKWPVFLCGAVLILMKPHHGLIPTLLLAHRMITRRRWAIFFDPDFIALAVTTSLYIAATWFFFNDYATKIMPNVALLYTNMREEKTSAVLALLYLSMLVVLLLFPFLSTGMDQRKRNLILFLTICAMISLVPFYVQGMAFAYHLFPAISFAACAFSLQILWFAQRFLPHAPGLIAALIALGCLFYSVVPLKPDFPRHSDYAAFPLTKLVQRCKGQEHCSFFMFHPNMGVVHETAHYSGIPYASRFAALWFVPPLFAAENAAATGHPPPIPLETARKLRTQFSEMMAQDLMTQKPPLAIIAKDIEIRGKSFDFVAWFSADPAFRAEWAHYKKTDTVEVRYSDYFTGSAYDNGTVIKYDVYARKTAD